MAAKLLGMNRSRAARWALGAALAGVVLVGLGYWGGKHSAQQAIERLQVLWPDVLQMKKADRALIARISLRCGLGRVDGGHAEIVNCLRAGAAELDREDAPDYKWSRRLEELLAGTEPRR